MNSRWKKAERIAAALLIMGSCVAAANAGKPVGAKFLDDAAPASVLAMDGAATAVIRGAGALFTNPAGASEIKGREALFTTSSGIDGTTMQSVAYAQSVQPGRGAPRQVLTKDGPRSVVGPRGTPFTFGASAIYTSYGKFQGYDENNNQTGSFNVNDMALAVSVARKMGSSMNFGASVKGIQEHAGSLSSTGFAGDLGLLSKTPWRNLDAAVAITNIGPSLSMSGQSYSLPTQARFGLGYQFPMLTMSADLALPTNGGPSSFGAAFQVRPVESVAFRLAYVGQPGGESSSLKDGNSALANFAGMSAGFGINLGRYAFDYALLPHQTLGNTNRISLSARF